MSNFIVPAQYEEINLYNGALSPSTVHVKNSELARVFKRYLLQDAMSAFTWELPKTWDKAYFLYVLYIWGYIGILNTDRYGVIPQHGALGGRNVFYGPSHLLVANPLFDRSYRLRIGEECTVIRLAPDYRGLYDLVDLYGDMMALAVEAAGINLVNSKLSFIFGAKNKAAAESFKTATDQVMEGNPAVYIDKDLLDEDGKLSLYMYNQDVGGNFITDKLLETLSTLEYKFRTAIGIPNVGYEKSERLTQTESELNGYATVTKASMWLDQIKDGAKKAREMFGVDIRVEWRPELKEAMPGDVEEGAAV